MNKLKKIKARNATWSQYKHHNTIKFLIVESVGFCCSNILAYTKAKKRLFGEIFYLLELLVNDTCRYMKKELLPWLGTNTQYSKAYFLFIIL